MTMLLPRRAPTFTPPAGACDCHLHIYREVEAQALDVGLAFPPVNGGTIDAYLRVRRMLGLNRAVIVQPSAYGFDNSVTLDAMAVLGDDARGVAVVPPDVSDEELERLTKLGIRGVRFFMLGGVLGWDDLERLASRTAAFGWHVQLQMDGRVLHEVSGRLARLPGRLVIDHNGKFLEPVDLDHPGFIALRRLIDGGRTFVKTSGVYETSKEGPPHYRDVAKLAQALIDQAPDRCLFATNWPHPSKPGNPPDDASLVDLFAEWCGGSEKARRIMVENAEALYGFTPITAQGIEVAGAASMSSRAGVS